MTDTRFSLLLPVYDGDRAAHLRAAFVSSVQDQTTPPSEVVLVRDGPVHDELAAELDRLARESPVSVTRVDLPDNSGLAIALTRGLEACSHDVVARMDADDVSFPERFARQLAMIERGYDLVGTGLVEFEGDAQSLGRARVTPQGADIARAARFRSPFHHPTVMFRREAVQRAAGYQAMGPMEDYWLWARMISSGAHVENIVEPLVAYRVDAGAYRRRGGWEQLRAELALQRHMRRIGFTSRRQYVRNLVVRGGYRLVPTLVRRTAYRRTFLSSG
ncbi:glycosyltransferase [Demequina sp. NBRC 110053]|uniref:glycosyltransferase n=1 Tax=Demequina sp. NBRC 110053 TaxID=1570342 RepID=UPI0009FD45FD|nr:glycosyltransferase [Demequina sp. NBRC 110053]